MRSGLFIFSGVFLAVLLGFVMFYHQKVPMTEQKSASSPSSSPSPFNVTLMEALPTGAPSVGVSPQVLSSSERAHSLGVDSSGLSRVTVVMQTTAGEIQFKFYSQDAPKTVARMMDLIQQGFYNGLSFHRVVPGFVVQGGDPLGTGMGGSGQKLEAEFNHRRHQAGTVAMARSADIHSADSQFYIALGPQPHLDEQYTVFGQVIQGLDIVQKIKMGDKMISLVLRE